MNDGLFVILGIFFVIGVVLKILKNKDKQLEDFANNPENRRKARERLNKPIL